MGVIREKHGFPPSEERADRNACEPDITGAKGHRCLIPYDELAALRAADPLDPASLPSPDAPEAQAMLERMTMTDTSTQPAHADVPPTRRRRRVALGLAAAVVVALAVGAVAISGDDDREAPGSDGVASGPITPGGPSVGFCVEIYDLETLANRELAFDGTVASVDGDAVTFTVNRWYRGGGGRDVTVNGASALSGLTPAGANATLDPGTRLLVAGDGGFAWACGFTQPYDPAVAKQWAEALVG